MFFEFHYADSPAEEVRQFIQKFISRVEVHNMIADSSKRNKLRNVYTLRSTARNVTSPSKNGKFAISNYKF